MNKTKLIFLAILVCFLTNPVGMAFSASINPTFNNPAEFFAVTVYKTISALFTNQTNTTTLTQETQPSPILTPTPTTHTATTTTASPASNTTQQKSTNTTNTVATPTTAVNPVQERIVEKQTQTIVSGVTLADLQSLENRLKSEMYQLTNNNTAQITNVYHTVSDTNKIDMLNGVDISNASISNSTISGTTGSFGSLTLSGAISGTSGSFSGDLSTSGSLSVTGSATSTFAGGLRVGTNSLVVDSNTGHIGIGTLSTTTSDFQIKDPAVDGYTIRLNQGGGAIYSNSTAGWNSLVYSDTYTTHPYTIGYRAEGTYTSPSPVQDGDILYTMSSAGYDGSGWRSASSIIFNATNDWSTARDSDMRFYTSSQANPSSEKMRIDSYGNIGIGTTSPYSKLSVVGTVVAKNFVATSTTATSTFAGNISIGGHLYDSYGNIGAVGSVLKATTTGVIWDAPDVFTIVAMGQSNMVGHATGGDISTNPKVKVWNTTVNDWILADPSANTDETALIPFADGWVAGYNNLAFNFAKRVQEQCVNCEVRLIFEAQGSQSITEWVGSGTSSAHYVGMRNQITNSGTTKVDAVLWHQGEEDASSGVVTYAGRFQTLVDQLRAEPEISDITPIIAGELRDGETMNSFFRNIYGYVKDPYVAVAKIKDFADIGDSVHFTGESLETIGLEEYYAAYKSVPQLDRSLFIDEDNSVSLYSFYSTSPTATKKFGIGTLSPNYLLHLQDYNNNSVYAQMTHSTTGTTNNDGFIWGIDGSLNVNFINKENSNFKFYTNNTQRMIIDSSGNLGVGSTSPFAKLAIENTGSGLSFAVNDEASDASPFVIDASGSVGIGTTSPYSKLSVVGTVAAKNFVATSTTATSTFAGNISIGGHLYDSYGNIGAVGSVLKATTTGVIWDAPDVFTIVAMGQSNMVGWDTGGDISTNSHVKVWNATASAWVLADPSANTDATRLLPSSSGYTVGNNNLAFNFAKKVAEQCGDCEVRLIYEAEGARPISDWVGSGTLSTHYVGMRNQITNSGTTKIDAILWHQGESDSGSSNFTYANELQTLIYQLRNEPEIASTTPFIAGELREGGSDEQNPVYRNIHSYISDPYVAVAKIKDFADKGDSMHFTGANLVKAGRESYYDAYKSIPIFDSGYIINQPSSFDLYGFDASNLTKKVGIGTLSPNFLLHLNDYSNDYVFSQMTSSITGTTASDGFVWGIDTSNNVDFINRENSNLKFYTNDTERLVVDSTGKVGVASTSPWRTLSVNGTAAFTGLTNDGTGYYACVNATTGELSTSTTACGASSERYKTNIQDLTYGLDTVMQLNPVSFDWKQDFIKNGTHQIGFIAEQVAPIIPEVIGHDDDGNIMNLDYPKLTAVLVNAVKELASSIDDRITNALASVSEIFAQKIVVSKEICIGNTCINENQLIALLNNNGVNATQAEQSGLPSPTIQILGNNPAQIQLNSTYVDLGVIAQDSNGNDLTVTATVSRRLCETWSEAEGCSNPASSTTQENITVSQISLDTSTTTTYIIQYSATDGNGLTTTAEREVTVGNPTDSQNDAEEDDETATTTETTATTTEAVTEPTCDSDNLNLCATQSQCESISAYWYNDTCNLEEEEQSTQTEQTTSTTTDATTNDTATSTPEEVN